MDHRRWEQFGGAAGIIAVALFATGAFLPGTIAADASAGEIRQFTIDNRDQLLAQSLLMGTGVLLFLMFLATLRNVLRRTEEGTGELSAIMSGSALVAVTLVLACVAMFGGLVYKSTTIDASVSRLIFDTGAILFAFSGIPTAVFAGAASVLLRRSEVFPAWMAGLGWLAAVLNALSPATILFTKGAFSPIGAASYVPSLVFFLFVVGLGGVLVRHPEAGEVRLASRVLPTPG